MSCSVPGCRIPPEHREEVKAERADALRHLEEPRTTALTDLCPTHRAEFERLGWLAPPAEEDEDGSPAE